MTDIISLTVLEGSLASGKCTLRMTPNTETIRFLRTWRGMEIRPATFKFGESAVSYTFLGVMSDTGGALFSVPLPVTEAAVFRVKGDVLTISSPVAVEYAASSEGLVPLLRAYGERNRAKKVDTPVVGWNSWDNFNASVMERDIIANMDGIEKLPWLRKELSHIIVDDGWQTNWGEWSVNGKFPSGMDGLAKEIHRRGFKAGLWLAPLMVEPAAPLYQRTPECLLKDSLGNPYLINLGHTRTFYGLDVSVKKSQEFLRDTFRRVRDWGYDYLKLDFLYNQAGVLESGAHAADASWSTNRHVAEALSIIRDAVGKDVFILACNPLYELGDANINEARMTGDIASFWENSELALQALAARFFMLKKWMLGDPVFTIVRVPGKTWADGAERFHVQMAANREQDPNSGWRRGPAWDEEGMKFALAVVILSGGSIILGDHIPQLNERGLSYIKKALEYGRGEPGYPLDLNGKQYLPCVFRNDRLIAFFNPFPTPHVFDVPGIRAGKEIFTGDMCRDIVTVPPRAVRMFELR